MVFLMRIALIFLLVFLLYSIMSYISSPDRKLLAAKRNKQFFLLDDPANPLKNLFLTYKGILFEGEKYIDSLHSGKVVTIHIWHCRHKTIDKLSLPDQKVIERALIDVYPEAEVEWKNIHPD